MNRSRGPNTLYTLLALNVQEANGVSSWLRCTEGDFPTCILSLPHISSYGVIVETMMISRTERKPAFSIRTGFPVSTGVPLGPRFGLLNKPASAPDFFLNQHRV